MPIIKQIKPKTTAYDIAAKYDINENEIATTYATKTEIGDISTALSNIILQTEAILGYSAAQKLAEEAVEAAKEEVEGEASSNEGGAE